MIKPVLTKRVSDIALAFRDRLGARQPSVDIVGERLIGAGDIARDLGLPPVEGIHPYQQPLFQHGPRFGIKPGTQRIPNAGLSASSQSRAYSFVKSGMKRRGAPRVRSTRNTSASQSYSHSIMNERLNL